MSTSVFQIHDEVYTAEQKRLFVLQLLEREAKKDPKNDTLKIWCLSYSVSCYEDFYGIIIK